MGRVPVPFSLKATWKTKKVKHDQAIYIGKNKYQKMQ